MGKYNAQLLAFTRKISVLNIFRFEFMFVKGRDAPPIFCFNVQTDTKPFAKPTQCWSRCLVPYGVTRRHCVNDIHLMLRLGHVDNSTVLAARIGRISAGCVAIISCYKTEYHIRLCISSIYMRICRLVYATFFTDFCKFYTHLNFFVEIALLWRIVNVTSIICCVLRISSFCILSWF